MTEASVLPNDGSALTTSPTLLAKARSHDESAWRRLVELYTPLVRRWCRSSSVQEADIDDLAQAVFLAVHCSLAGFQSRQRGSFRCWIKAITRNKVADFWRQRANADIAVGGSDAHAEWQKRADLLSENVESEISEERKLLYNRALELIAGEFSDITWRIFYQVTVEGKSVADVAASFRVSKNVVYLARSRVVARLREEFVGIIED